MTDIERVDGVEVLHSPKATLPPCGCPICREGRGEISAHECIEALIEQVERWEGLARHMRDVFGDLIDALGDELKHEISHSLHVQEHIKRAVSVLGGPWNSYEDAWWLGGTEEP